MSSLILIYHTESVDRELLAIHAGQEMAASQAVFPHTVRDWVRNRSIFRKWRNWETVAVYTDDRNGAPEPLLAACAARWLGKRTLLCDAQSAPHVLDTAGLARMILSYFRDALRVRRWLRELYDHLSGLETALTLRRHPVLDLSRPVAYLRPDIVFHLRAGGSVTHMAGVLNNLGHSMDSSPILFAVDSVPTLSESLEIHCIRPSGEDRWTLPGMTALAFSRHFSKEVIRRLAGRKISFLYQRHGLDNWSGVELALTLNVPFVLEYNGPEVWVARHWGKPARRETISLRLEELALHAADCIVVMSQPLKEELVDRGIAEDKILVNPNGVNPEVYRPDVDGSAVRRAYGLEKKVVIGFIGTFGKWHGVEVLAEAFGMLMARRPDMRQNTCLFYVGDGVLRTTAEEILRQQGGFDSSVFTGPVPQADGPSHLAACDILVSPNVPNPDGTKFFGSPTKVFEYMAMGRAIAASALDQLDEILEDGVTALKATPGDAIDLARVLERLADDPKLRARLGAEARNVAVERHSWRDHTRRIVDFVKERCS